MKKIVALVLLALAGIFLLQLSRTASPGADEGGRRIISLAPSLTEILFELGVGDSVVGVTSYCNYPPETDGITRIGDFMNPNLEGILSLKPDLVVAERWTSSKTTVRLRGLGLEVLEMRSPHSLEEIYQMILAVGNAVGRAEQASQLIQGLQERVAAIRQDTALWSRRPRVYVEIDPPTWTVGHPSFIDEAIRLCGGRNIFAEVSRPALQASREVIMEKDPEVILSFYAQAPEIQSRPGWDSISAVRDGAVIDDLNRDLLSRGSPRFVLGMEELHRRLKKLSQAAP